MAGRRRYESSTWISLWIIQQTHWFQMCSLWQVREDQRSVGKNLSTKSLFGNGREDVTRNYKYPEGQDKNWHSRDSTLVICGKLNYCHSVNKIVTLRDKNKLQALITKTPNTRLLSLWTLAIWGNLPKMLKCLFKAKNIKRFSEQYLVLFMFFIPVKASYVIHKHINTTFSKEKVPL